MECGDKLTYHYHLVVDNLDESEYDADTSKIIGEGIKMYMQEDDISYDLKKTKDGAMHISPRPNLTGAYGDGLYLRSAGSGIVHRGEGTDSRAK